MSDFPEELFISEELHERTVKLGDGKEYLLNFKEVPEAVFRRFHKAESSDSESVQAFSIAKLIAASLCGADGKPAMSFEKAASLKPAVASKIMEAILDVNGFKGTGKI